MVRPSYHIWRASKEADGAHALVTDRERALEAGCDEYDTKPVDFERLNEKIESLLLANTKKAR